MKEAPSIRRSLFPLHFTFLVRPAKKAEIDPTHHVPHFFRKRDYSYGLRKLPHGAQPNRRRPCRHSGLQKIRENRFPRRAFVDPVSRLHLLQPRRRNICRKCQGARSAGLEGHQGGPQDRADGLRRIYHSEPSARNRRHRGRQVHHCSDQRRPARAGGHHRHDAADLP